MIIADDVERQEIGVVPAVYRSKQNKMREEDEHDELFFRIGK